MKSLIIIAVLSVLLAFATASCRFKRIVLFGDRCEVIAKNAGLSLDHFLRINPGLACKHLKIGAIVCTKGDPDSGSGSGSNPTPPDTNPPTDGGGGDDGGGDGGIS